MCYFFSFWDRVLCSPGRRLRVKFNLLPSCRSLVSAGVTGMQTAWLYVGLGTEPRASCLLGTLPTQLHTSPASPHSPLPSSKSYAYEYLPICLYTTCAQGPQRLKRTCSEQDNRSPRTGVADGYELPCGYWPLNPDPLEEQSVLPTTEPPTQPPPHLLLFYLLRFFFYRVYVANKWLKLFLEKIHFF